MPTAYRPPSLAPRPSPLAPRSPLPAPRPLPPVLRPSPQGTDWAWRLVATVCLGGGAQGPAGARRMGGRIDIGIPRAAGAAVGARRRYASAQQRQLVLCMTRAWARGTSMCVRMGLRMGVFIGILAWLAVRARPCMPFSNTQRQTRRQRPSLLSF